MKISICVPQYNRINFLLQSLDLITQQTYADIEIVISDDCSTDGTEESITALQGTYKYPLVYFRNKVNKGYDANYRQCIELATGDYCIVIGNDDSIHGAGSIQYLADFLEANNYPEIGYVNFVEAKNPSHVVERAYSTGIMGSGPEVALKNYSCFSFVGGLIYHKKSFERFNTSKHDGSIYSQMYLGCRMIASGCRLFSIKEPLIIKDLEVDEKPRQSYRDVIARKWRDYKIEQGGLPSVINVLIDAFRDSGTLTQEIIYKIFRRIYCVTYPHWVIDYKSNGALPAAVGLVQGLHPVRNTNFKLLSAVNRVKLYSMYLLFSGAALVTPAMLFNKVKSALYARLKK